MGSGIKKNERYSAGIYLFNKGETFKFSLNLHFLNSGTPINILYEL